MNERIQELAYDAEELADAEVDTGSEFHPAFCRIFAELIVRECIARCDDLNSMKYIADHFGIKIKGFNDETK